MLTTATKTIFTNELRANCRLSGTTSTFDGTLATAHYYNPASDAVFLVCAHSGKEHCYQFTSLSSDCGNFVYSAMAQACDFSQRLFALTDKGQLDFSDLP